MPAILGSGINLATLPMEDWHFPFLISGAAVAADVGKAVTLDTAAANTVKLAGDGDEVLGRLEVFEDRVVEGIKVATVALKGAMKLPYLTADPVAVGDSVQGSGTAGKVKKLAPTLESAAGANAIALAKHGRSNLVVAKDAVAETVTVILF